MKKEKHMAIIESVNPGVIWMVNADDPAAIVLREGESILWFGVASSDEEAFEKFKEHRKSYPIPHDFFKELKS